MARELCTCKEPDFHFYCATNEDGWKCVGCQKYAPGDPAGFSPRLDREEAFRKVGGILNDLHGYGFVYISNGTMGDMLTAKIADRCVKLNRYDQYTIIQEIMNELTPSHAEFWEKQAKKQL